MHTRTLARVACQLALVFGGAANCAPAFSHITAQPNEAVGGTYFQTTLNVPHGCDGSSTVAIQVAIPADVLSVKPQMKAGWRVDIQTRAIEPPLKGEHGASVTRVVSSVEWRGGPLPDSLYDSFGLVMKLPEAAGKTLYFPVVQTCESGRREWTEIPADGQSWHALHSPAPFVRLKAADAAPPAAASSTDAEPAHVHSHSHSN
ncbi:YcnI family protein [Paraburkholderia fungorum]|uniref:YcnI family protein n=1 Tax=Paraburkholderia fungorum TaxID=134537 RepID=UPI0038BD8B56